MAAVTLEGETVLGEGAMVLDTETPIAPLSVIALEGAKEMGEKINKYLVDFTHNKSWTAPDTFLVKSECPRFASGEGKGLIKESIRGKDLFILVDVGNYSCTYEMFSGTNQMSPDDHYQDLKRIIQAAGGKARRISVIMPYLYCGRQHKRSYRESLDIAVALQELEKMGVENLITFDAHDSRVSNAVPLMGFDNIMPSYQVLKALLKRVSDLKVDADNFMVCSPDEGAMHRNMYYSSVLRVQLGMFYKRRDYSLVVNGRNPIAAHEYLGNSVEGKDVFVADDIISSGESMLEVSRELKKRKARRIIAYATYPIFTNGLEAFDKAHAEGSIDYVFGTNLTYLTPELKSREWFREVDISKYIAYLISAVNCDTSISKFINPSEKTKLLLAKYGIM